MEAHNRTVPRASPAHHPPIPPRRDCAPDAGQVLPIIHPAERLRSGRRASPALGKGESQGKPDKPRRSGFQPDKLACARFLAAGLAYLAYRQRDAVGLMTFDAAVRDMLVPLTQRGHLQRVFEVLERLEAGGETDTAASLERVGALAKRRGLIVLLSDLLDEPEALLRALQHFRHRGHDVIVFQVLDRSELDFDFRGPLVVQDLETGRRLATDASEVRGEYVSAMADHLRLLKEGCRSHRIDHEVFVTDRPFGPALAAYLARRRRAPSAKS